MTQREKLYAKRDAMALDEAGNYYINHVMAMGSEQLHSKSAIASELAHRDMLIDKLTKELQTTKAQSDSVLAQKKAEAEGTLVQAKAQAEATQLAGEAEALAIKAKGGCIKQEPDACCVGKSRTLGWCTA